jgi:hypothetical protein
MADSEMSAEAPPPIPPPALDCTEILYRAITTHYWVKKGKVKAVAFRLRALPADEHGLSVNPVSNYTIEQVIDYPLYTCYAVATLHTGKVRDLQLDVIPDPPPPPTHANIIGLPRPDAIEPGMDKTREDMAEQLAEQARLLCYTWPMKPFIKKKDY